MNRKRNKRRRNNTKLQKYIIIICTREANGKRTTELGVCASVTKIAVKIYITSSHNIIIIIVIVTIIIVSLFCYSMFYVRKLARNTRTHTHESENSSLGDEERGKYGNHHHHQQRRFSFSFRIHKKSHSDADTDIYRWHNTTHSRMAWHCFGTKVVCGQQS